MSKNVVSTTSAPGAVGPYSQAIKTESMVYTAGQVGLVPGTKSLIEGGIEAQTRQVLENLKAVLEAAGSSLDKAVKTTVFLKSMDDFAAMNSVYASYFTVNPPARSTVAVSGLPLGALVEIEVVALL
jgi:2-iminobutanoate/2-iminopropanoate deaminase